MGHAAAIGAMEAAGPGYRREQFLEPTDPFVDQPAVHLDLLVAGSAEESEPAALALEMGPGADQPAALVGQVRELDLQPPLPGPGPGAENLQDQRRPIDDLGLPRTLEVALLDGRERAIDYHQRDLVRGRELFESLDHAEAEQGGRTRPLHADAFGMHDHERDRLGEADGLR